MATKTFEQKEFRNVLGSFVTGVTVVTTVDRHGTYHGLTVNSFSSVSLDPPLVLWSQSNSSPSRKVFLETKRFAINILAEDQVDLSNRFARSGQDKFFGLQLDVHEDGLPILTNTSAWLSCELISVVPGGDHTIYIGQVSEMHRSEQRPLVFGGGKYLVADAHDISTMHANVNVHGQLRAVRMASRAIARLSADFDLPFALAVWGNRGPTVLNWAPAETPPHHTLPLGLVLPVTSTATGVAFAAYLPEHVSRELVETELTSASRAAWENELDVARDRGLAIAIGRYQSADALLSALSAPVLDGNSHAVLTITAVRPSSHFMPVIDSALGRALQGAARSISRRICADGETSSVRDVAQ